MSTKPADQSGRYLRRKKMRFYSEAGGRAFNRGYRRFCSTLRQYYKKNRLSFQLGDSPTIQQINSYLFDINRDIYTGFTQLTGRTKPDRPGDLEPLSIQEAIIMVPAETAWVKAAIRFDCCMYTLNKFLINDDISYQDYKAYLYRWQKTLTKSSYIIEDIIKANEAPSADGIPG
jgi:hypothetical protein